MAIVLAGIVWGFWMTWEWLRNSSVNLFKRKKKYEKNV